MQYQTAARKWQDAQGDRDEHHELSGSMMDELKV
jgi:hypothetical protein